MTKNELRQIVQAPIGFESLNSLYFTPTKEWPTINAFYTYGKLNDAQITNFFEPDNFNDVQVNSYGVALQYEYNKNKPEQFNNSSKSITFENFFIRGEYARTRNHGVIEFFPDNNENINKFGINSAFLFRLNNQILTLFPNYTYLDIDQDMASPYTKKRHIFSLGFSYGTQSNAPEFQPTRLPITSNSLLRYDFS